MKICKCDLCGKTFDEFDEQENFGLHYGTIGYGSAFDGEVIDVDMCCNCFDDLMKNYITTNEPKQKIIKWSSESERLPTYLIVC